MLNMLKRAVEGFLSRVLAEFRYHPFIAPYLNADIQPYTHQWEVIARLCVRNPVRVLIGDEIGLGKTITALVIAKYMEALNRAKRVLIVVPRVLVEQWRKELVRVGIPESKIWQLERETVDFINRNFFEGYYIASMDLLKREERINEVTDVSWDLVIIDEVHKFGYRTERFWRIGKMIVESKADRNVVFLSATPHRGDPRDYILRLRLLDPYLTESWKELDRRQFYESTHGAILFRRTKEDINRIYEEKEVFPPARFHADVVEARKDEAEFIERLVNFLRSKLVEFAYERGLISERIIPLLTVLIFKRATSSPYAAMTTLERLLLKRVSPEPTDELVDGVESFLDVGYEDYEYKDPDEVFNEFLDATSPVLSERDRREIEELRDMARSIMEKGDSKLNALITLLEDILKKDSKVIIFTEYRDTLDYIINNLKKQRPEWSGCILKLSSEDTDRNFRKIRNAFERNPKARILITTDVVAEGVNLQVAHILINYEVPWSLVKLEQRTGRVWRIGQKKEVEAHTLFMANMADLAALNSMYKKLLNLRKAKLSPRLVTGQEILLYADIRGFTKFPPSTVIEEEGKKKILKVTEVRTILTYLREDKEGLEKLIASILAAKRGMEREMTSKRVLYKPKTRDEVENTIGLLGFKDPSELFDSMKEIVRASSGILGFEVYDRPFKVVRGTSMPITLSTISDIYGFLKKEEKEEKERIESINLVSYGNSERVFALLPVQIEDKRAGIVLYKELIGIDPENCEIFRGSKLLKLISQAVSGCLGVEGDFGRSETELPITSIAEISENVKKSITRLLEPIVYYTNNLTSLNLRDMDGTWIRPGDIDVTVLNPIACLHFVEPQRQEIPEDEDLRREVEERAVEFVMRIERSEGRMPEIVPDREHYDIRSVDPSTGEIRIIEVKGHLKNEIHAELTHHEAELAERERDRYWLYIVYDIGGDPKFLRFKDPVNTMSWKVFERTEKRYLLWPKIENLRLCEC